MGKGCATVPEGHVGSFVRRSAACMEYIAKRVENVLVDGTLVEIKIVEEWGYAMGEDTCLFEEESESEASQSDYEEGHVESEVRRNVDILVEKFADGLEDEECDDFQGKSDEKLSDKPDDNPSVEGESEEEVVRTADILTQSVTKS
ncbi:DUF4283 domain protein, partial [Trifolium medium]|nr:DUF4283 domain protein [Trifolium medium]